ncbi:MAG: hypothetical protein XU15_C0011G0065 [candidate division NC10 bacterium CSP1-5]|nr:MAG: hypothetical protein XU15_C0011G0065 [candidate division NC10 bacterium CSP1-5]
MRHRYWVSWFSTSAEPLEEVPFPVWNTGSSDAWNIFCAVIDAEDVVDLWDKVKLFFPDRKARFCDLKPTDWMPIGDQFSLYGDTA